jgi:hypothetical protein
MNHISSLLSDGINGTISSKRVVTLLAFLMCAYGFIAMVCGYPVDTKIYDSMMYIVIAGLGFTASEKFVKKDEK